MRLRDRLFPILKNTPLQKTQIKTLYLLQQTYYRNELSKQQTPETLTTPPVQSDRKHLSEGKNLSDHKLAASSTPDVSHTRTARSFNPALPLAGPKLHTMFPPTVTRHINPVLLTTQPLAGKTAQLAQLPMLISERAATFSTFLHHQAKGARDLVAEAFSASHQKKHRDVLLELDEFASTALAVSRTSHMVARRADGGLTITPHLLQEYLEMRRLQPRGRTHLPGICKWSHMRTLFGTILGALRDASLYGSTMILAHDPALRRIDKTLTKSSNAEATRLAFPMTPMHVSLVLQLLSQHPPLLALMCMVYMCLWYGTSSRPFDALRVQRSLVTSHATYNNRPITTVLFMEGKSVTIRGPYSVHTILPRLDLVQCLLRASSSTNTHYLFPERFWPRIDTIVHRAMKDVDPKLEKRSVRRGSLQALAMAGADESTLLTFSGHKDAPMLWRYLNWGQMRGRAQITGAAASVAAWQDLLQTIAGGGTALGKC